MNNSWQALLDFIYQLQYFHFLRPYWLLLLIPFFWVLRRFAQRDDSLGQWRNVIDPEIVEHITIKGNSESLVSPRRVSYVLAVLITLVLAGPSWQQKPSPFAEDKAAVILALDLSNTMQQSDLQPSRLLRAKQKVIELLELRGDANTALIAYAGSAHVVMPITNDQEMIKHFLNSLETKMMPVSGKRPEQVLSKADVLFSTTDVPGTLVLIGDGASQTASDAFEQYFRDKPHRLIVYGIGDATRTGSEDSNLIPLQTAQLEQLASNASGRYLTLGFDNTDVKTINRWLNSRIVIVDDEATPWFDSGYPLVVIIALAYLLWFRSGWTLQW